MHYYRLLTFYICVCIFMFYAQHSLIYNPSGTYYTPQAYGLKSFNEIDFPMSDNSKIKAWHKPAKPEEKTIIFIHGNAGNIGGRSIRYQALADALDIGILATTYRGYPGSDGKPSETRIYQDFAEILQILATKYNLKTTDLILYGSSLGSGVATEIASKNNIHALILESPFTSVSDVAKLSYWYLPVDLILQDRFDSVEKAPLAKAPTLIIHAQQDKVVPLKLGLQLYDKFKQPKELVIVPQGSHVNLDDKIVTDAIKDFLKDITP